MRQLVYSCKTVSEYHHSTRPSKYRLQINTLCWWAVASKFGPLKPHNASIACLSHWLQDSQKLVPPSDYWPILITKKNSDHICHSFHSQVDTLAGNDNSILLVSHSTWFDRLGIVAGYLCDWLTGLHIIYKIWHPTSTSRQFKSPDQMHSFVAVLAVTSYSW